MCGFRAVITRLSVLVLTLLCSACARQHIGHDISRPLPPQIVLGKTSEADIVALYGQPQTEQRYSRSGKGISPSQPFEPDPSPGAYVRKEYFFIEYAGGQLPEERKAIFSFHDDVLIGYNYRSDFPADATRFDEGKVSQIVSGRSTESDILRLFGEPSGRSVYPLISLQNYYVYSYSYRVLDVGKTERSVQLDVLFAPDGTVKEYRLDTGTKDVRPTGNEPGTTVILIPSFGHR